MTRIILFLFTFLILLHSIGDDKKYGKEYTPGLNKSKFNYLTSFGETNANIDIINDRLIVFMKSDKFTYKQTFKITEEGLYLLEVYQKVKPVFFYTNERNVTYDKPLLKLSYPMWVGKEWISERTEYFDDDSTKLKVHCKVIAEEEVNTLAGKFTALRIQTSMKASDGSENIVNEWIAPNLGTVKVVLTMKGGGILGTIRKILGYGEITFELKDILNK